MIVIVNDEAINLVQVVRVYSYFGNAVLTMSNGDHIHTNVKYKTLLDRIAGVQGQLPNLDVPS